MGDLQDIFDAEIEKLPEKILWQLISDKLEECGVVGDNDLIARLSDSIMKAEEGRDALQVDGPDVSFEFTDEDLEQIDRATDEFVKGMPALIEELAESAAKDCVREIKILWRENRPSDEGAYVEFRGNLNIRWGEPLNTLKMLLEVSRSAGQDYFERLLRSKAKKNIYLRQVLIELHARSCQVASEILTLMENGYADGASARWRTLHEITVVSTLIADSGDNLAERYLAYEAVEAKRELDEYLKHHVALGEKPPPKSDIREISAARDAAVAMYGAEFARSYGWAIGYLGTSNRRPNFTNLEEAVGRSTMRPQYKLASYNVHASPFGLVRRLGGMDNPTLLVAGATNAGLEVPGINTAISLAQLTCLLLPKRLKLDEIAFMQTLILLRDQATNGFFKAARKLERDEAELWKSEA